MEQYKITFKKNGLSFYYKSWEDACRAFAEYSRNFRIDLYNCDGEIIDSNYRMEF